MIKNNKGGSQKITCPNCEHQFAWGDAQISEEQKAIYTLHQHGYSIRSIGRMLRINKILREDYPYLFDPAVKRFLKYIHRNYELKKDTDNDQQ